MGGFINDIDLAVSGLRGAFEITKALLDLKSLAEVQAKVIAAFSAQTELANAHEEARKAQEQLARMKAWDTQRQRYKLTSPWPGSGSLVYALIESASNGEPAHWICTSCYENGRRSILNPSPREQVPGHRGVGYGYNCPVCKSVVMSPLHGVTAAAYAPT